MPVVALGLAKARFSKRVGTVEVDTGSRFLRFFECFLFLTEPFSCVCVLIAVLVLETFSRRISLQLMSGRSFDRV